MSDGRVELGLGAGWFEAEHRAYGIAFPDVAERFDRFSEQVAIVHGLLTTPEGAQFDFDGAHYRITDSPALPKPVQSPPPLILGGNGRKRGAALAARYADEYNVPFRSRAETTAIFDRVRAAAADTGRSLRYTAAQVLCVGRDAAEVQRRADAIGMDLDEIRADAVVGTPAEAVDRIGSWAEHGASRLYLQTLDLSDLDHLALVAAEVLPQV